MTHKARGGRLVGTEALARVEGEGAMYVEIDGDEVRDVRLDIYEPPRFYEGFLRGRAWSEPPDITARICGICPVAYQMSACAAIEDAFGVDVGDPIRRLRRLLYAGEWIESHTLHIHFLHAPDFFGVDSGIELAAIDRPAVERALELKKLGNRIVERIGGRAIHPVNIRVGGFHRLPTRREIAETRDDMARAADLAEAVVDWVSRFDFADFETTHELVAVKDPAGYPVLGDRIVSDRGLDMDVGDFDDHVVETHVPHSTALHAHLVERGEYLVGPLARYSLASAALAPRAAAAARAAGLGPRCGNPFRSIVVRAVETLHACEVALDAVEDYVEPPAAHAVVEPRAGVGHGVTEAPRGLLYHRYAFDADGTITDVSIVPPTSQNQAAIEHDLWHFVEDNLHLGDDELRRSAEVTIRNHDPCISCATHFLDLTVVRS